MKVQQLLPLALADVMLSSSSSMSGGYDVSSEQAAATATA